MSDCHHCTFSKTGVKCLFVFFDQFSKIGGRCLYVRFDNFSYNYPELGGSSPFCHYDNILEAGGKFLEIPMGELNARKINV